MALRDRDRIEVFTLYFDRLEIEADLNAVDTPLHLQQLLREIIKT